MRFFVSFSNRWRFFSVDVSLFLTWSCILHSELQTKLQQSLSYNYKISTNHNLTAKLIVNTPFFSFSSFPRLHSVSVVMPLNVPFYMLRFYSATFIVVVVVVVIIIVARLVRVCRFALCQFGVTLSLANNKIGFEFSLNCQGISRMK